jgi:integrase
MGYVDEDPTKEIRMEKGAAKRTRHISKEEEDRLVAEAVDWLQPIITFATATGMRRGEIMALEKDDINVENRTVIIATSKNGEPRILPLSKRALEAVSKAMSLTSKVFGGKGGETLQAPNLEYNFRMAAKRAGLKDLHFHDLRHTFATRLIQTGADIYSVQKLLGHKTLDMTARYSHHNVDSLRRVIDKGVNGANGANGENGEGNGSPQG